MKKTKLLTPEEEVCHWQYLPTIELPVMHWSKRECFRAKTLLSDLQGNKPDLELTKKLYNGRRCSYCGRMIQIADPAAETNEEKIDEQT